MRLQFFKTFNFITVIFETICPQLLIEHSSHSNVYHLSTLFTRTPAFYSLSGYKILLQKRLREALIFCEKKWDPEKYFGYILTLTFKTYFQNDENRIPNLRPNRSFPKLIILPIKNVNLQTFKSFFPYSLRICDLECHSQTTLKLRFLYLAFFSWNLENEKSFHRENKSYSL